MVAKKNNFFTDTDLELISTIDTRDIKSDIYARLWGLGNLLGKRIESELFNIGLTIAQFLVMYLLYLKFDRTTPAVITKRTALKKHTVSRVVSALEDSGIVKRTVHPKDRRTILVSLTAKGNVLASKIVQEATGDPSPKPEDSKKNPAAVALGRLGGLKGGKSRASSLSAERRKEIARKAAQARWGTSQK